MPFKENDLPAITPTAPFRTTCGAANVGMRKTFADQYLANVTTVDRQ
jgi:hypothetical protein